jgi:hypothetical protein
VQAMAEVACYGGGAHRPQVAGYALVDDADLERVLTARWRLDGDGYVRTTFIADGKRQHVRLHRFVLGLGKGKRGEHVDHINGDKRDNRRSNLRVVTSAVNGRNRHHANKNSTSSFRGVSWDASRGKWKAQAKVNRKGRCLGRFDTELEAKQAVDKFWERHNGNC